MGLKQTHSQPCGEKPYNTRRRGKGILGIGDGDGEFISTLDNGNALLGGDAVGDLSAVGSVVHHEELKVVDVVDDELSETIGEHVLGELVGTETDSGHLGGATVSTSAATINTLGLTPVLLRKTGITMPARDWERKQKMGSFL